MNSLVSALIGETTTTSCCGAVSAPLKTTLKTKLLMGKGEKDKKKKKVIEDESSEAGGDETIIPADAVELENPGNSVSANGALSDDQLEKLADLVVKKLVPHLVRGAAPEAAVPAPPVAPPEPKEPKGDQVAQWIAGQGARESVADPEAARAGVLEALKSVPSALKSSGDLLSEGLPMPPPVKSSGHEVFKAFMRFAPK